LLCIDLREQIKDSAAGYVKLPDSGFPDCLDELCPRFGVALADIQGLVESFESAAQVLTRGAYRRSRHGASMRREGFKGDLEHKVERTVRLR
jgi:hypothetical protein